MRYPKFLTKGDKISFVATSFGATTKPYSTRVKYAKRTFEKLGYEVNTLLSYNSRGNR